MNAQRKTTIESMIKIRDELYQELNDLENNGANPITYATKCGQLNMLIYILKRFYNVDEN